jgi:hypothetical protein
MGGCSDQCSYCDAVTVTAAVNCRTSTASWMMTSTHMDIIKNPKYKNKSLLFSSFVRTKWHNSTVSLPNCSLVKAGSAIYTSKNVIIKCARNLGPTSKFLGARKVTWRTTILGTTIQNLVATITWHPGFVHSWCKTVVIKTTLHIDDRSGRFLFIYFLRNSPPVGHGFLIHKVSR